MILASFLKGIQIAFYIVLPIGALSVIYLKRTLQRGLSAGFASALGVACVETLYAIFAIYGASKISQFLINWQFQLKLAGLTLIIAIGVRTMLRKNIAKISENKKAKSEIKLFKDGFFKDFISIAAIAIVNPLTILGFTIVFSLFSAGKFAYDLPQKLSFLSAFFLTSVCYSMFLISIASTVRNRLKSKVDGDVELINFLHFLSGLALVLFALFSFLISLS